MSHQEKRVKRDPVAVLHDDLLSLPDGIKGAAKRIGRSPGILYNKLSDSMPGYDIMQREATALAHYVRESSGSTRYAEAVCDEFDGVFLPLPQGHAGEDDVLQAYLDIINSMGALAQEFTEARADGIIEPSEFSALKLRGHRAVAAIMHLLAELETTVREVPKPANVLALNKDAGR